MLLLSFRLTEDEGIHTMDSEDDEFSAAVPRNTEILKAVSARRAYTCSWRFVCSRRRADAVF